MKLITLALTSLPFLSSVLGGVIGNSKSTAGNTAGIDSAFVYSSVYNTTSSIAQFSHGELPYPIVEPIFSGTVDGHAYKLSGPLHSIDAQLQKLYPGINLTATTPANITQLSDIVAERVKRDSQAKDWPIQCFRRPDWENAHWWMAEFAEKRLMRDKTATFFIKARSCARMYCGLDVRVNNFGVELYTCNDRFDDINPNLAYLASYVMNTCWTPGCWKSVKDYGGYVTQGQFFDTDGYNVITRGNSNPPDKGSCRKLLSGIPFDNSPVQELS